MTDNNTPAPSLTELPPEYGTILELHSIGSDEFDGKIVEFLKLDKETGKYFVLPFDFDQDEDEEEQGFRVKAKCCKRPDIRPLRLRKVLVSLAQGFFIQLGRGEISPQETARQLKKLLEKDPSCSMVHYVLGMEEHLVAFTLEKDNPDRAMHETKSHRHFRRCLVNYRTQGYEESIPDRIIQDISNILAFALVTKGHRKSALKLSTDEALQGLPDCPTTDHDFDVLLAAAAQCMSIGQSYLESAENQSFGKKYERINVYVKECLKGFKILSRMGGGAPPKIRHLTDEWIGPAVNQIRIEIKKCEAEYNQLLDEWKERNPSHPSDMRMFHTEECDKVTVLSQFIVDGANGILGTLTEANGLEKYLHENDAKWLMEKRDTFSAILLQSGRGMQTGDGVRADEGACNNLEVDSMTEATANLRVGSDNDGDGKSGESTFNRG